MTPGLPADELAEVLGGTWIVRPSDDWRAGNLISARQAAANRRNLPHGALITSRNPSRSLERIGARRIRSARASLLFDSELQGSWDENDIFALHVPRIDDAVGRLARAARAAYRGRVVAVTGSVGKTSTVDLVAHLLAARHSVYRGPLNANTLDRIQRQVTALGEHDLAVFEVARVALPDASQLLQPNVAVVTAIAEAHLETFGTLEEAARVKSTIFEGLAEGGTAVVNGDAPYADLIIEAAFRNAGHVLVYGRSEMFDAQLLDYEPGDGVVRARFLGEDLQYRLSTAGEHNALNSLAALAVLHALDVPIEEHLPVLKELHEIDGRGAKVAVEIAGRPVTIVDQSYNANPMSMSASLRQFGREKAPGRRLLLLGDMLELGPSSPRFHAELVAPVVEAHPDKVFVVGSNMMNLWCELPEELRGAHLVSAEQVPSLLRAELLADDTLFVKASLGSGLNEVVERLKHPAGAAKSLRLTIRGPAVQGVGYRRWMRRTARSRGLAGWVRNGDDGTVEAVVSGYVDDATRVVADCMVGPRRATVSEVVVSAGPSVRGRRFRLRRQRR